MGLNYAVVQWCDSRKDNFLRFLGVWDKKSQALEAQQASVTHTLDFLDKKSEAAAKPVGPDEPQPPKIKHKVQVFDPAAEGGVQFATAAENLISRKYICHSDKKHGELRYTTDVYSCPAEPAVWVETCWGGQAGLNRVVVRQGQPEASEIDGEIKEVDLSDAASCECAKKAPNKMGSGNKKKKTYAFHIAYQPKHLYPC